MTPAQRDYRARVFAEANRRSRRMRPLAGLSSIVWGTRRGLGTILDMRPPIVSPMLTPVTITNMGPIPQEPPPPVFPGNPDTRPGAWVGLGPLTYPGNEPPPPVFPANGSPGTVVVTPTSGPIPPPGTVAAGTTAPASWLDGSMIAGIPNKFLLLGGLGAFLFFGGKHK
jgi:hypothetical protein